MTMRTALSLSLLAVLSVSGVPTVQASGTSDSLRFVALGDMPYGKPAKVYPRYEALIAAVNATSPALVIHVGDTKSAKTRCSDKVLADQRGFLDSFTAPVLYTPGDNEWTDCHRKKAGRYDPLERLAHIRKTYFERPETTLGGKVLPVAHQGARGLPENARLMLDGVMIVTTHVVGSNNGFEARDIEGVREFFARDAANIDWLDDGVKAATDARAEALVLAIHADMFEFDFNEKGERDWLRHSGYRNFGRAVRKAAHAFDGPVLLIFGDSHRHRVFRPFPDDAPNLTALEVFGEDNMHAVEITLRRGDGTTLPRFAIAPLYNPAQGIRADD